GRVKPLRRPVRRQLVRQRHRPGDLRSASARLGDHDLLDLAAHRVLEDSVAPGPRLHCGLLAAVRGHRIAQPHLGAPEAPVLEAYELPVEPLPFELDHRGGWRLDEGIAYVPRVPLEDRVALRLKLPECRAPRAPRVHHRTSFDLPSLPLVDVA